MTALMQGKKGLIMGVANDHSIAWGIAKELAANGAELAFTYQGEALKRRVEPLAQSIGVSTMIECDVTNEASMDALFEELKTKMGKIDFVVHAIAFSDKEELRGRYMNTTHANFINTMDISVFSFTDVCRRASEIMNDGGSCLTLSYLGAERVLPNYNVMGVAKAALEASVRYLAFDLGERKITVNAISAGPVRTLAASGIGGFRHMMRFSELNTPLGRNISLEEVGGAATFLLSKWGAGVTGEVLHVDSGYHAQGMVCLRNAKETSELLTEDF
ncbi:MAG: SDR family oxidoreductase [Alphaproteobacteria bacterium]|nr:SDR family oxidoreductase [Alphaproteobacteria bacterium]